MPGKKGNKLLSNAVYQTLYQVLATITPLITSPYIARELGAADLGMFSFSNSMVTYFTLFAMLGVVNYGTRTISQTEQTKPALSRAFWSVYLLQALTSAAALLGYGIYIALAQPQMRPVALVQAMLVLACFADINWFFFGIEDFKLTVTRNIIIKLATVAAILLFVKQGRSPLLVYAAIMAGGTLLANLSVLPFLRRHIGFYMPSAREIRSHIRPNITLFIPLLASSVFHVMDKTMLGSMARYEESGYYYNADKLVNIPLSVLKGLGTVFLPRATAIFKKSAEQGLAFLRNSFKLNMAITYLLAFGIAGCAREFVPFFFGEGYDPCILLTIVFTPVLVIKSISMFYQMQYLVPTSREKVYISATFVGAGVNAVANYLLIPRLGAMGAVIGTMLAEFAVMLVQMVLTHREIPAAGWLLSTLPYGIMGCIMVVVMRLLARLPLGQLVVLGLEIAGGGCLFLIFCAIYWFAVERRKVRN